jgi:hypothetical protein
MQSVYFSMLKGLSSQTKASLCLLLLGRARIYSFNAIVSEWRQESIENKLPA